MVIEITPQLAQRRAADAAPSSRFMTTEAGAGMWVITTWRPTGIALVGFVERVDERFLAVGSDGTDLGHHRTIDDATDAFGALPQVESRGAAQALIAS